MDNFPSDKLQLLYESTNSAEELQFLIDNLCKKQKELLKNLLNEELDNIEDFASTNEWVSDRVDTINSILERL